MASKIIIIGGPARAGKTTLAATLADCHGLSVLAWDSLLFGLHEGAPSLGVDAVAMPATNKALTWPVWETMLAEAPDLLRVTIAEGGPFLPREYAQSARLRGKIVKLCYLGFADVSLDMKMAAVRRSCAQTPDWTAKKSDSELAAILTAQIEYSRMCETQARQVQGMRGPVRCQYFDTGNDFHGGLQRAADWIRQP